MTSRWKCFENIGGKGENAGNEHFLFFPQYFLPFPIKKLTFESHLFYRLQMLSIRTGLKFCRLAVGDSWLSHTSSYTTFFPKPLTTFITFYSRGERRKYAGKKVCLNRYRTHNHQVMSSTCSPLSHPGWATLFTWKCC